MKQIHVPAGTTIVKRGEPGDTFCIVESGTCSVLGEDGQVRREQQLPGAHDIGTHTRSLQSNVKAHIQGWARFFKVAPGQAAFLTQALRCRCGVSADELILYGNHHGRRCLESFGQLCPPIRCLRLHVRATQARIEGLPVVQQDG